ncbi:hypothetical protein L3X38_016335 [Prunus dulcis]|uniref:Uncharacterized protein n=1 Tax=Prunus dulcis TaxID=3755 RepID=A0AAD4W7M9_PRUDU|nr:hypothetical protein L3X38_016335 [Prunus dulcis]
MKRIWKTLSHEIPEGIERLNHSLTPEMLMFYHSQSPERKGEESGGCGCGSYSRPSSPCCSRTARALGSRNGCGSDSDSGSDSKRKRGSGGGGGDRGSGGGGRPSSPGLLRASASIFFFLLSIAYASI